MAYTESVAIALARPFATLPSLRPVDYYALMPYITASAMQKCCREFKLRRTRALRHADALRDAVRADVYKGP